MNTKQATVICHDPPGCVDLRSCQLQPLSQGQVMLETLYSAISPGTELRCLRGEQPGAAPGPFVPGYQSVGRIIETGPNCHRQPGELVFNANAAGYMGNLHAMWGAHSSHVIASQDKVVDLPEGITLSHASIAKLTAIALHGLKTAGVNSGDRIAVIGLGPLGQLSSRLAKIIGAEVIAFDRIPSRVALATSAGIEAVCVTGDIREAASESGWPDKEFDVIVDATGIPQLVDQFIDLARELTPWDAPGKSSTRYVIQGSYAGDVCFNYQAAFLKELQIFVPRDHYRTDIVESLDFICSGKLEVDSIIGELVKPEDAKSVYSELSGPGSGRLTAVFDWSNLD